MKLLLITLLLVLTSCSSDVEKCVEAYIRADGPFKNDAEKNDSESRGRIICLRAQSGK